MEGKILKPLKKRHTYLSHIHFYQNKRFLNMKMKSRNITLGELYTDDKITLSIIHHWG